MFVHRCSGLNGVCARGEIDAHADRRTAVEPDLGVLVLRTHLDASHVLHMQHRPVRVRPNDDRAELVSGGQAALGLDVHLKLLVIRDRAGANAADRSLHVLGLDGADDVGWREAEARQPLGIEPDAHRVVETAEQGGGPDTRRARQLVHDINRRVVRHEQRIVFALLAREENPLQDRGGFLLHLEPLRPDLARQLRERRLRPVVDIDRVDVGIGAKGETDGQGVGAVIAAAALHVEHLVDAHDLRLERLGDRRLQDLGGGARINRGYLDLRRDDVGQLRKGNARQRQRAGDAS